MQKTPVETAKASCKHRSKDGVHVVFAALILGGLLFASYANTFGVPFIFDDKDSILTNPSLRQWSTALFPPSNAGVTVSGRPVLNLTLAINYAFGGRDVTGYHVANLLIHFAGALVLFGLVRRTWLLDNDDARGGQKRGNAGLMAFLVAALWALHPLQTESVTYVVQRAESLVGFFFLLTLYCFARSAPQEGRRGWLYASVVACFLGMGSKEVMAGAPILVLFYDRAFVAGTFASALKQRRWYYACLFSSWLFLLGCIASTGGRGGTVGFAGPISAWKYALTQCEAIVHYVKLAFWPNPQVFDYGRYSVDSVMEVRIQGLFLLVALGTAVWLCICRPRAGFLAACFFVVLAPTSSFFPIVSQTVAEHRFYLALAVVIISVVSLTNARWGRVGLVLLLGLVPMLAGATFARNRLYHTEYSIWWDTAEKMPSNARAWFVCGFALSRAERYQEARVCLERALTLEPDNTEGMAALASMLEKTGEPERAARLFQRVLEAFKDRVPASYGDYYYYGMALMGAGDLDGAIEKLQKAVEHNPEIFETYYVLGNALLKSGRKEEAIDIFRVALSKAPEMIMIRTNLGKALNSEGRYMEAVAVMRPGLPSAPPSAELRVNLGVSYQGMGRASEARSMYIEALEIRPGLAQPHVNLALLSLAEGKMDESCRHYQMAIANGGETPVLLVAYGRALCATGRIAEGMAQIKRGAELAPLDIQLQYAYASSLLKCSRWSEAAAQFECVLRISPDIAEAHNGLGVACRELGLIREARLHFQEALRLRGDFAEARANLENL